MAYIKLSNNKGVKVTSAQAAAILDVLEGRKEPEDNKQANFIETVHKVYIPWREAPAEYIAENAEYVMPMILGGWAVNSDGVPTRPDSKESWDIAHRMRLWEHGGPSVAAKFYINKWQTRRSYASGTLGNKANQERG